MEWKLKLKDVIEDNIDSRISSYVFIGKLNSGKTDFFKTLENIEYINFEDEAQEFFTKNNLTLREFNRGKFFEHIKAKEAHGKKAVVIDNLEIIQNILFEDDDYRSFFKEMKQYVFRTKVIFIFSNIKKMKITKYLQEEFPEKNIIIGELYEN